MVVPIAVTTVAAVPLVTAAVAWKVPLPLTFATATMAKRMPGFPVRRHPLAVRGHAPSVRDVGWQTATRAVSYYLIDSHKCVYNL